MNAQTLKTRLEQQQQNSLALSELWASLLPGFQPSIEQFRLWVLRHGFETTMHGIHETAAKFLRIGAMSPDHMIRFASRVMLDHDPSMQRGPLQAECLSEVIVDERPSIV